MSTDEYSQDLPDELYMQGDPSMAYPNMDSSGYGMAMPDNVDMTMQMPGQDMQRQVNAIFVIMLL